jgi:hypothetical protein
MCMGGTQLAAKLFVHVPQRVDRSCMSIDLVSATILPAENAFASHCICTGLACWALAMALAEQVSQLPLVADNVAGEE